MLGPSNATGRAKTCVCVCVCVCARAHTCRGTVRAAGNLVVDQGRLLRISPHSGHYMPSADDMNWVLQLLTRRGVDMSSVVVDPLKSETAAASAAAESQASEPRSDTV